MLIEGEKREASPDSLADEIPSPKRILLCPPQDASIKEVDEGELMEEKVNDSAINNMQTEEVTGRTEMMKAPSIYEAMIGESIDSNEVKEIAGILITHEDIVQILEEFLCTLAPGSEDTIANRALQYFDKVKSIWENQHFIVVIRPLLNSFPGMTRSVDGSMWRQSEFIVQKIKSESLNEDIFEFQDRVIMMRNGLSVLIGYWSNEEMFVRMLAIGGHSLRTLLKGEERGENKMRTKSSTPIEVMSLRSSIRDLRQDSSITELADRLLNISGAEKLVEDFLKSLQLEASPYTYYLTHYVAASHFWCNPSIILELIEALKKSKPLVSIFKKYSERSQLLRCVERITRIQKDPLLNSILTGDLDRKMRGALSILFGYTVDTDVYEYSRSIRASGFGINKDHNIQIFEYLAKGPGDVEGLKNVLVEKCKDPGEYSDLFEKIRKIGEMEHPHLSKKKVKSMTKEMKEKAAMDAKFELGLTRVMLRDGRLILYEVKPLRPFANSYRHSLK